jgi:hypothetical protein
MARPAVVFPRHVSATPRSKELATCADAGDKRAWYEAQQRLRNQPDRTYDVRMGFSLADLKRSVAGTGTDQPPAIDVLSLLVANATPERGSAVIQASDQGPGSAQKYQP